MARYGNKNRLGKPHSQEIKNKISRGVRRAYADGRRAVTLAPENLAAFNEEIKSGKRLHPRCNPQRDLRIASCYLKYRDADIAGEELGITRSAVYYALKRAGVSTVIRNRNQ